MSYFNLGKLPYPDAIKTVDYQENFDALYSQFCKLMPEYSAALASDPIVKLLEACAYVLTLKDQARNDQIKSILLAFAEGNNLDNLGALLATQRQASETDERFRARILSALSKASTAGAAQAYEALSLEADSRVSDVKAYDDPSSPAQAFVTIQSSESSSGEASADLVRLVSDYLNAPERKPLGAQVIVTSVRPLLYTIHAMVRFDENADNETVKAHMVNAMQRLSSAKHHIGAEIALSEIYAGLNMEGVSVVESLSQPRVNIKCAFNQTPVCTSIKIDVVRG